MRSLRLLAAATTVLALVTACGDNGGNVEPNQPPSAAFTAPSCVVSTPCQFTDASTDDHGIATRDWDFGDGSTHSNDQNPAHTYAAEGSYTVTLTVTDADGESDVASNPVTVAGSGNVPPTASFTAPTCVVSTACAFHSTSTDDGTITATHWDFGDGASADGVDATHTYAAAGTFNVVLTVTDDQGATGNLTLPVTVSTTAGACTPTGVDRINCPLDITSRATIQITLVDRLCELGNRVTIDQPVAARQTVWFNVCNQPVGSQKTLVDATGAPLVFEAGSRVEIQFVRGTGDPPPVSPQARLSGAFPSWTLNIDDGGNPGGPGEPDFTDVVLSVQASAQ